MDKLEEIRRHHWKERLTINKIAKFKSDTSLASEGIALQSCENLETFVWWGGLGGGQVFAPPPPPTPPYKPVLNFNRSLLNLAILLILGALFIGVESAQKGLNSTSGAQFAALL